MTATRAFCALGPWCGLLVLARTLAAGHMKPACCRLCRVRGARRDGDGADGGTPGCYEARALGGWEWQW